ncbi:hypothetical protein KY495_17670 [Massilia sp. PAMC28688]|uniref:hypothetical protein n=1 Tax=Massilia sp. PAMC28688 TaxID=2861283 RepID=UPI001C638880|nr:hypothetical protein [Massilia sp. PAMC28688]QYF92557.1 hypothetical protein KY495_17670 [Massilia sp. PAMC28688]
MKTILSGACALLLLAGCQTPYQEGAQMGVRVNAPNAANARVQYDQVVILDRVLQNSKNGKIAIEAQGARRTATGTLQVIVTIRNRTDHQQVLEARTSYFDSGFAPTEKPSGWSRIFLEPNGVASYTESSMGAANVAHYYVEVKEAR